MTSLKSDFDRALVISELHTLIITERNLELHEINSIGHCLASYVLLKNNMY